MYLGRYRCTGRINFASEPADPLPPRRLRSNPRVLKKLYRKYKRKPHDAVPVPPFDPNDHFLDFVILLICLSFAQISDMVIEAR